MSELKLLKQDPRESVREYAYRVLSENILSLNLVPGTAMSEKEISDKLSVSRTPVREAFIHLAQDGLLEILPQRGSYVSKIDIQQISEFRFLRLTLEQGIMALACKDFSEYWCNELKHNLLQQQAVIQRSDSDGFYQADNDMHCMIFTGCDKPHIWQIVQGANINYIRARVLNIATGNQEINILYEQHKQIVDAILKHDEKAGHAIITTHINKVIGDVGALQRQYPEYFQ